MFPYFVIYIYQIPCLLHRVVRKRLGNLVPTTNIKPCSYVPGIIYVCRILTQSPTITLRKLALKALSISGHQH